MSDTLIVGQQPKSEVGKEYFLHCLDWWYEILHILKELDGEIPFEDWFVEECWLCPPTPFMDEEQSRMLSGILKGALESGRADRDLDSFYHEDELMIDYFDGDEDHMKEQKGASKNPAFSKRNTDGAIALTGFLEAPLKHKRRE